MTAAVCQDFVLALFLLLFSEWIYLIMWWMVGNLREPGGGQRAKWGIRPQDWGGDQTPMTSCVVSKIPKTITYKLTST